MTEPFRHCFRFAETDPQRVVRIVRLPENRPPPGGAR